MRPWIAIALACQLLASPAIAEVRRVLLTVDGLNLPANQTIRAFHVETWGVGLVSVCHLPPSWELKTEKFEDPEGRLDGKADTHGEDLKSLSDMFLVDVYDYQPNREGSVPATFSGWVVVGRVEPFDGGTRRKRTLKAGQFRMRDAKNCPTPPSPQP
jgi:hypothetical protein